MSDIHNELEIFEKTFEELLKPNLQNKENKLILLGDYLARRNPTTHILHYIKNLQEQYKDQIIILMGNHEFMFLEDIENGAVYINDNDSTIIPWLKSLPFYYETDTQIYVHAGIDEEADEYWKWGTEDYFYCSKYPHTIGKFYKDIIAGHISTSSISKIENYHEVFYDGKSHFYIDGDTENSKFIPLLKYDTINNKYSSFKRELNKDNEHIWCEYIIK